MAAMVAGGAAAGGAALMGLLMYAVGKPKKADGAHHDLLLDPDSSPSGAAPTRAQRDRWAKPDVAYESEMRGVDAKDKGTPDDWVERHPDMIRLTGRHPFNSEPPLDRLVDAGFHTPSQLHIVRNHGAVPRLSWDTHKVSLGGLVARPATFSMDELASGKFPVSTFPVLLPCAGNRRKEQNMVKQTIGFNWGAAAVGVSHWTGVHLCDLLRHCGVDLSRARYVCFEGPEGELPGGPKGIYGTSIVIDKAMDRTQDVLIAFMQNGERLRPDHGFPVRVILPGHIGGRTIKWLCKMTVTEVESDNFYHYRDNRVLPSHVDAETATRDGWWEKPDYIINHLNIQSATAYPRHDETVVLPCRRGSRKGSVVLERGKRSYTLRGYAYAGGGNKVHRVEVSLDGGKTWTLTKITHPWETMTPTELWAPRHSSRHWLWCFWEHEVDLADIASAPPSNGPEPEIAVRAWDVSMNTQPGNLSWNVMGMLNNCWFRIKVHKRMTDAGLELRFEHPTIAGPKPGGWMNRPEDQPAAEKKADAPKAAAKNAKTYTMAEVRKHNKESDVWIVVADKVYDCTPYLKEHPGGAESIMLNAGDDSTEDFEAIHSKRAWGILDKYYIGDLAPGGAEEGRAATAPPPEADGKVLSPQKWVSLKLASRTDESHDTRLFTFALPRESDVLGLPCGAHFLTRMRGANGKAVIRAYTPVSNDKLKGSVELLIKVYPPTDAFPEGGKMSQLFDGLKVGDTVEFKGPVGELHYHGKSEFTIHGARKTFTKVNFVAGGTGITPVYQLLKEAHEDPLDGTKMSLAFGNRTPADILCRSRLDEFGRDPNIDVEYVVSEASKGWKGEVGYVNRRLAERVFHAPSPSTLCALCGPPGMVTALTRTLKEMGHAEENIFHF